MDKNQISGLVIMLIIMTVYFQFFAPEIPQPQDTAPLTQSESTNPNNAEQDQLNSVSDPVNDSIVSAAMKDRYGLFAGFAMGEAKDLLIENDKIKITLSSKGAKVKSVELKDFTTYDQKPLILLDEQSSQSDLVLISNFRPINISELNYQVSSQQLKVNGQDSSRISFKMAIEDQRYIEHVYTLSPTGYELDYKLNLVGMEGIIDNQDAQLTWTDKIKRLEEYLPEARQKTTVNYYSTTEGFDDIGFSEDKEESSIQEPVKWFAFKQKFFLTSLIAENTLLNANFSTSTNTQDSSIVKTAIAKVAIPIRDLKENKGNFTYYFGPADYQITKGITNDFGSNVDLGWSLFRAVNQYLIIPIFDFLEQYISSYGIIIILLVFVIRVILAPLTYKSHMSMAKMKVLKPEMDEINEKFKDDAQKKQTEVMSLYSKAGVNPLSGCIPMLLQFPFLLAMFNFFPNSIELRQQSFLWAHDLSTFDSILDLPFNIPFYGDHISLFTLLMTASTILYTWSNSQMNTQMQGPMKTMQYMMPIMFLFFLNSYSSGLTLYYFISNIASFGQIALFRKFVDEDKIHEAMQEYRKKNANKKKSGFRAKLEDAMKTAQEQQKKKKK